MRLNQFTVTQKLWSLVGCLLAGLLLVTAGSLYYLNGVYAGIAQQVQQAQQVASLASEWRHLTELSVDRSIVAAISSEENLVEQQRKLMTDGIARINELQKQVTELAKDDASRKSLEQVAQWRSKTLQANSAVQKARGESDFATAYDIVEKQLRPAALDYMGAQQAFVKLQEQRRNQAVLNGESSQRNAYVVIAVVCSIIVLLGLVTATLILRTITSPLHEAVALADRIADGDLTAKVAINRHD